MSIDCNNACQGTYVHILNSVHHETALCTIMFLLPLTECGEESGKLFSNLEAVMAREQPGLSRSLTFEPGKQIQIQIQIQMQIQTQTQMLEMPSLSSRSLTFEPGKQIQLNS